jgi:hypothetical protein
VLLLAFESVEMRAGHVRALAFLLDVARWGLVVALVWLMIAVGPSINTPEGAAAVLGIFGLVVALMSFPVRRIVGLGGRDSLWELRGVRVEATHLGNLVRTGRGAVSADGLRALRHRLERARNAKTAELCDLLAAELSDLASGAESWNEAGRRTIRIDELSREFWPGEMPEPDYEAAEATFRWHLYRAFGRLMDLGTAAPAPAALGEFERYVESLSGFRRDDTAAFIGDVTASAKEWLAAGSAERPWIDGFDFSCLGANGPEEVRRLWGRDSALWGAALDDEDRLALSEDLARRSRNA